MENHREFSICNFCLDFSRSFCSRQNHRGRCEIKAGDDAKVEGSCCNDERAELAIVAALLLHLQSLLQAPPTLPPQSQWLQTHIPVRRPRQITHSKDRAITLETK